MSTAGFNQDEIQAQLEQIKDIKNEYDSLTPDEKKTKTYTLDEVKEMLGYKNPDEGNQNDDDEITNIEDADLIE